MQGGPLIESLAFQDQVGHQAQGDVVGLYTLPRLAYSLAKSLVACLTGGWPQLCLQELEHLLDRTASLIECPHLWCRQAKSLSERC
jgi:hypothetical protein